LAASQPPFKGPYFLMAVIAYWLQVGAYLQAFGKIGPRVYWYMRTIITNKPINNRRINRVKLFISICLKGYPTILVPLRHNFPI